MIMKLKTLFTVIFQIFIIYTSFTQSASRKHYIGEKYGGGVVYHLWLDSLGKQHGLIVYPKNYISGNWENNGTKFRTDKFPWSNIQNKKVNSLKMGSYGSINSTQIATQRGHQQSAAQVCLDFTFNGYSDWYLPSIEELLILYKVKSTINFTLYDYFGGTSYQYVGIVDCTGTPTSEPYNYLSSTEYDESQAYGFDFCNGKVYVVDKGRSPWNIRPIRSF